jgi:hypothetical protein
LWHPVKNNAGERFDRNAFAHASNVKPKKHRAARDFDEGVDRNPRRNENSQRSPGPNVCLAI